MNDRRMNDRRMNQAERDALSEALSFNLGQFFADICRAEEQPRREDGRAGDIPEDEQHD